MYSDVVCLFRFCPTFNKVIYQKFRKQDSTSRSNRRPKVYSQNFYYRQPGLATFSNIAAGIYTVEISYVTRQEIPIGVPQTDNLIPK
jgi:hypothetical protein